MSRELVTLAHGHTCAMAQCVCGDVFSHSGSFDDVRRAQAEWGTQHEHCSKQQREGRKVFWLSFCDNDKPTGQQFLGACVVEVTAEEADDAEIQVLLRFPLAQPGAEWIAAATAKAHRLGCNPGGEVASIEIPTDHPNLTHYAFGVLMDRATCERIDALAPPVIDCVSCDGYVIAAAEAPHCPSCARMLREGKPL